MTKREHHWHKSTYSAGEGRCVEVAEGESVLVRDTQYRHHGHLTYTPEAWATFLRGLVAHRP